ncbi:MAG: rhodanese-like domain-containing protein [Cyclobacteriaceae bacterium]
MLQFFKNLFSSGPKVSLDELMENGAIIVDVRSKAEFAGGHLTNSINIPLDVLKDRLSELDNAKPVITCCASGIRSASAKNILKSNGFNAVKNGGGWSSLKRFEN